MKKIIQPIFGLALFSFSLTVLYLSMRAVMAIGGTCAEGGAYVIKTHCPGNTEFLAPLSIFAMFGGASLYFSGLPKNSPNWSIFFWSALFFALGWNFLEFSVNSPQGGLNIGWLLCGVVFVIMGGVPLFMIKGDTQKIINAQGHKQEVNTFKQTLLGQNNQNSSQSLKFYETQPVLLILHVVCLFGGIYLGYLVFMNV